MARQSFKKGVKKFSGVVHIQDIQDHFDYIIGIINSMVDTVNAMDSLKDADFTKGSTNLNNNENFTLTLGGLKRVLEIYDKCVIGGPKAVKIEDGDDKYAKVFPSLYVDKLEGIKQLPDSLLPWQSDATELYYNPQNNSLSFTNTPTIGPDNWGYVGIANFNYNDEYGQMSATNADTEVSPGVTTGDSVCYTTWGGGWYNEVQLDDNDEYTEYNKLTDTVITHNFDSYKQIVSDSFTVRHRQTYMQANFIDNPLDYTIEVYYKNCYKVNQDESIEYLGDKYKVYTFGLNVIGAPNTTEPDSVNHPYLDFTTTMNKNGVEDIRYNTAGNESASPEDWNSVFAWGNADGGYNVDVATYPNDFDARYNKESYICNGTEYHITCNSPNNTGNLEFCFHSTTLYDPPIYFGGIEKVAMLDWKRGYVLNTLENKVYTQPSITPIVNMKKRTWAGLDHGASLLDTETKGQFLMPNVGYMTEGEQGSLTLNGVPIYYVHWAGHRNNAQCWTYNPLWIPKGVIPSISSDNQYYSMDYEIIKEHY